MVQRADAEVGSRAGASAGGAPVETTLRHVRGPGGTGVRPEIEVVHWWDRVPWWLSAALGCVTIAVLSVPQAVRFGQGAASFGWYPTADGRSMAGVTIDQELYLQLVDWFRGRAPRVDVAPFTGRALTSWLAHFLPVDPATALLVVNVALLCAGCVAIAVLVRDLTGDRGRVLLAVAVWSVSFPVIWYTARFVDGAGVGLLAVLLLTFHRRRIVLSTLLLFAAVWSKETAVVFVAVAVTHELLAEPADRRRWTRAAWWVGAGAVAYATREALAGGASATFAPWVPADAASALWWGLMNLARPGGVIPVVLAVLPTAVALWLWSRRHQDQLLDRATWVPLAVGAAVALVLAGWSVWSALLDGRTAWMALPMTAVLLACWRDPRPVRDRPGTRTRVLRAGAVAGALVVVMGATLVGATVLGPDGAPYVADLSPRFAAMPTGSPTWSTTRGHGDGTIALDDVAPDGEPVTVDFRSDRPLRLSGPGLGWMARGPGASAGTVLVDDADARSIGVRTDGTWEASVRAAADGPFAPAGGVQEWTGTGPMVLLHATGVHSAYRMRLESTDPRARVRLAGRCRLGTCGPPQRGEIRVPVGTESVSIEAVGPWRLVPIGADRTDPAERLPGTR